MYNITGKKAIEIKNICRVLNIGYRVIEENAFGYKLCYLIGMSDDDSKGDSGLFNNEMLYLIDFSDGLLNIFLKLLRSKKCPVALKAVSTEININYTSFELYNEISAEHMAMQSGERFH